jgi:hypothetical protein
VGMLEPRRGLDLAQETVAAERGAQFRVQDLDGDVPVVPDVMGQVDRGHAVRAELALHAVAPGERRGEALHGCAHVTAIPPGVPSLDVATGHRTTRIRT